MKTHEIETCRYCNKLLEAVRAVQPGIVPLVHYLTGYAGDYMSVSTARKHLGYLAEAGLVRRERRQLDDSRPHWTYWPVFASPSVPPPDPVPVAALTSVPERLKVATELESIHAILAGKDVDWSKMGDYSQVSRQVRVIAEWLTTVLSPTLEHNFNDLSALLTTRLAAIDSTLDGWRPEKIRLLEEAISQRTTELQAALAFIADNMPSRGWTIPAERLDRARAMGDRVQIVRDGPDGLGLACSFRRAVSGGGAGSPGGGGGVSGLVPD